MHAHMLTRPELLTAIRGQRACRDATEVDTLQWAWHCGASYALAMAAGIDPNGPIPDDPEPDGPDGPGDDGGG